TGIEPDQVGVNLPQARNWDRLPPSDSYHAHVGRQFLGLYSMLAPGAELERSDIMEHPVLVGRDMLCFSHDWSGDPLSKTHLMRLLARDNRILWVNSIGYRAPTASAADLGRAWRKLQAAAAPLTEPLPNLFVLNPLAIPAWGSSAVRAFNQKVLRWQVR